MFSASLKAQDLGLIENWLRCIRDVSRIHGAELDKIQGEEEKHRKLVELNVIESCINVLKSGVVQKKRMESTKATGSPVPRIHAMVFDPKEGILKKIPVDFKKEMSSFKHFYDLY